MFRWLKGLFRQEKSAPPRPADSLWEVLAGTGNRTGRAPVSLRAIPGQDDEAFNELYDGELVDCFWHQGTIYAATPFAVSEVLHVIARANASKQESLLHWIQLCVQAERLGPAMPSHAGVWFPEEDQARLNAAGVKRPTIIEVIRSHQSTVRSLSAETAPATVRLAVATLLSAVNESSP